MYIQREDSLSFGALSQVGLAEGVDSLAEYGRRCDHGQLDAKNFIELYPSATSEPSYIKSVHERLFSGVYTSAGQVRGQGEVLGKRGTFAAEPARIEAEMELLRSQSLEMEFAETLKPVERAAFAGARVAAIAPFKDGNLRVAWQIINSNLISSGSTDEVQPMPSFETFTSALRAATVENNLRPLANVLHETLGNEAEVSQAPLASPFRIGATLIKTEAAPLNNRDELDRSRRQPAPTQGRTQDEGVIRMDYLGALRGGDLPLPTGDRVPAARESEKTLV